MKQSVIVNPADAGSLPRRNERSHGRETIVNANTLDAKEAVLPACAVSLDRLAVPQAGGVASEGRKVLQELEPARL